MNDILLSQTHNADVSGTNIQNSKKKFNLWNIARWLIIIGAICTILTFLNNRASSKKSDLSTKENSQSSMDTVSTQEDTTTSSEIVLPTTVDKDPILPQPISNEKPSEESYQYNLTGYVSKNYEGAGLYVQGDSIGVLKGGSNSFSYVSSTVLYSIDVYYYKNGEELRYDNISINKGQRKITLPK